MVGSPDSEVGWLLAELGQRMEEFLGCMREIPRVGPKLKLDVWRIAARKHDEMDALHVQLEKLLAGSTEMPDGLLAWMAGGHSRSHACGLIDEVQRRADSIPDPVTRRAACAWLARAWGYAEAGRHAQTVACVYNALALVERTAR